MSKKLTRKSLKHPDALQERLINFIQGLLKHTKHFSTIIYIILGVLVITLSYKYFNARQLRKDTTLYYTTIKKTNLNDSKELEKEFKSILPKLNTKKIKCYVSYKLADSLFTNQKYEEAIKYYEMVAEKGSNILKELAEFGLAKTYETTNKLKKAEKIYKKISENKFHLYRAISMFSLAKIYKENGKQALAAATLENMIITYKNTNYAKMAYLYKQELN